MILSHWGVLVWIYGPFWVDFATLSVYWRIHKGIHPWNNVWCSISKVELPSSLKHSRCFLTLATDTLDCMGPHTTAPLVRWNRFCVFWGQKLVWNSGKFLKKTHFGNSLPVNNRVPWKRDGRLREEWIMTPASQKSGASFSSNLSGWKELRNSKIVNAKHVASSFLNDSAHTVNVRKKT